MSMPRDPSVRPPTRATAIMDELMDGEATMQELAAWLNTSVGAVSATAWELKRDGLIEPVGKRPQLHTRGREQIVYGMVRTKRAAA